MKKLTAILLACTMLLPFPCLAQRAPFYHGTPLYIDLNDPEFLSSADIFCKHEQTEACQENHYDKSGVPASFTYHTCTQCKLIIRMTVAPLASETAAALPPLSINESGTYTTRRTVQERCCFETTYTYYFCNDCDTQIDMASVDNPNDYHFGPITTTIETMDGQEYRCKWCEDCGGLVSRVLV